jgi:thiosulfate/3-mercaptopyruvate sulfurtransferase
MEPKEPPLPLVSASWLSSNLSRVRVVDVRWYLDGRVGRDAYEAGHIPGAVHLDVDRDLSSPRSPDRPGRHPLPEAEAFHQTLTRAGLLGPDPIVAYDDEGGAIAARLWWLLGYFGHHAPARVLDGGLQAWTAAGGALEAGGIEGSKNTHPGADGAPGVTTAEAALELRPSASRVVSRAEVKAMSEEGRGVLLDARALPRYRGDVEPIDPRAGHIPGARSAPFVGNLVEPRGRFLGVEALRERYEALGARAGVEVVAYCGSGVTACHDLLALELAGVPARLYEGSWSDWSGDPTLPARAGSDP